MELTVLSVADCPHTALLAERLAAVGVPAEEVTWTVVSSLEQAVATGMHGSPTLLIDGYDPFAAPGAEAALACRLYRAGEGPGEGAPGIGDLRAALGAGYRVTGIEARA